MPALSPFERARVTMLLERFCSNKTVLADTPRLRFSFVLRGTSVTLVEERPEPLRPDVWLRMPFAQFRRAPEGALWTLHARDRRGRWHLYEPIPASMRLDFLLQVVDTDSAGAFLG
jgi:hypothetical protein